jgi:hypothetical protein
MTAGRMTRIASAFDVPLCGAPSQRSSSPPCCRRRAAALFRQRAYRASVNAASRSRRLPGYQRVRPVDSQGHLPASTSTFAAP